MPAPRGAWALAVAALSLGVQGADSAWLHAGYDPARSGATADDGPLRDDVAFTLALPGSRPWLAQPLLLGGSVYILTADMGLDAGLATDALYRVDLATAKPSLLAELPKGPTALASDGERLFVAHDEGVDGFALDGTPLWTKPLPRFVPLHNFTLCIDPVVRAGVLFLPCTELGDLPPPPAPAPVMRRGTAYLLALDAATGTERWRWVKNLPDDVVPPAMPGGDVGHSTALWTSVASIAVIYGVAVIPPQVFVVAHELCGGGGCSTWSVSALGEQDGLPRWSRTNTLLDPPPEVFYSEATGGLAIRGPAASRSLTGGPNEVWLVMEDFLAINTANGQQLWSVPVGAEDVEGYWWPHGLARKDDAVFAATDQTLYRVDLQTRTVAWKWTLPPDTLEAWGNSDIILAGDVLYARSVDDVPAPDGLSPVMPRVREDGPRTFNPLYAFNASTGELLWRHAFEDQFYWTEPAHFAFSVGEGVVAVGGINGNLTVLGRTPASIQPAIAASTRSPSARETVAVDLSGSRPGVHGPAAEFRASWGDGNATEWRRDPLFQHAYADNGTYLALFEVRNGAGQTASEEVVFGVGGALLLPDTPRESSEEPLVPTARPPLAAGGPGGPWWGLGILLAVTVTSLGVGAFLRRRVRPIRPTPAIAARGLSLASLAPGRTVLGRYRVMRKLGEGGSGVTYLCRDARVGRDVAVKAIFASSRWPEGPRALLREARAIAACKHPCVVTLHDVEEASEGVLIVMEYVEGGSLAERLARGPLTRVEFATVATDLLAALAAVHALGILHRDVKPSNVLLTRDGRAKLADFGVAHIPGFETTAGPISDRSSAVGTVRYMSPEQARGRALTPQSDLFSAAATLYEACVGRPYLEPLPGESAVEVQLRAASAGPFAKPWSGPETLRAWFAKALEPQPSQRFASATAMLAGLRAALGEATATSGRTPGGTGPRR